MPDQSPKRPHLFIKERLPDPAPRVYEGGGGGTYERTDYKRHAKKIYREAAELHAIFAKLDERAVSDRVYYRVELPKDESLASSTGVKLEENIHAQIVASPSSNVGHVSSTKESFDILLEQLNRYQSTDKSVGKSSFAPIEKFGEIPASEKISTRYKRASKSKQFKDEALISLFPDLTKKEQADYKKLIGEHLEKKGGEILNQAESETGLLLKVKAKPKVIEEIAEKVLAVQAIDAVDHLVATSSVKGAPIAEEVVIKPNRSTAVACLFDSGVVRGSRFLDQSIIGQVEPLGPPRDVEHGTFVASRIVFGDSLRDQIAAGELSPDVKVLSVCVSEGRPGEPEATHD